DYTQSIKAYDIIGSYCTGDYDLSIDGIKFAGISQRRVKNGISVQIYLDICGNSLHRAQLVQEFYAISRRNEKTHYEYPEVNPDVMGSLSELLDIQISVEEIAGRVESIIKKSYKNISYTGLTESECDIYERRIQQMIKRNEVLHNS